MASESRQVRYKRTHPWVRFVEYSRRRTNGKHTNPDTVSRYSGKENTLTAPQAKVLWERDGAAKMRKPSLDRIDAAKGYTFENCRFIELSENIMRAHFERSHMTDAEPDPDWVNEKACPTEDIPS